jgi:hypothetical protein
MQHVSDGDGSAILRISSNKFSIWTNSYQHRMQFDLFQTSSKFWRTWVGVHVLRVLSQIIQKGGGPCPEGAFNNYSNRWGSSPCPWGRILISLSSRAHLTPIPLSFHFRHVIQVRWCKILSINRILAKHCNVLVLLLMFVSLANQS